MCLGSSMKYRANVVCHNSNLEIEDAPAPGTSLRINKTPAKDRMTGLLDWILNGVLPATA